MREPNDVWCADYKGQFKTRDGIYCFPLTVSDGCSRYLLGCKGLHSTAHASAKPVFRRLFSDYGLPRIIRTDNGVPFATNALSRLSMLSVWWIRLGIYPELIEPGHPEQNGRHERMHRTLKTHTARPPAASMRAQQRRFDAFRIEYNHIRPHEALGTVTPASIYKPSPRDFPTRLPEVVYPDHYELRYVSANGGIRFNTGGSTSATCSKASTLDWKRSTTESGTCTSAKCGWDGSTNAPTGCTMPWAKAQGKQCHPCPWTKTLPMSSVLHIAERDRENALSHTMRLARQPERDRRVSAVATR